MKIKFTLMLDLHWCAKITLILLTLCFCSIYGIAQQSYLITGNVTSMDNNEPLVGVTIVVNGSSSSGTISEGNGEYSIQARLGDTLTFSYIGFLSQSVIVGTQHQIDVSLETSSYRLDDIIVVGYAKEKRVNVIGSLATVSADEITSSPVSNISNALAGRLPGAIIQQRSGEPGGDAASFLIRGRGTLGNNSPLVVIDGIQGRDLNSINPNDVQSISVLKDASAAIYGSRAANGVILVTTKDGKRNTAPVFNYSFYQGLLSPTQLPEMANSETYATMIREMQTYKGIDPSQMLFSEEDIEKYKSGKYPWLYPNTNWWEASLRNHSSTHNHDFSVSGGSQSVSYYASLGTQFADGLWKNSARSFNRYNLRAKVDFQVNKYLSLGVNIEGSEEKRIGSSAESGLIFNVTNQNKPTEVAVWPNGLPGEGAFGSKYQPLIISTFESGFDDDKRYRSNNKIYATFIVPGVEGLSLSSYYAYDIYFKKQKYFSKAVGAYVLNEKDYLAAGNDGSQDGSDYLSYSVNTNDPRLTNYFDFANDKTFNFKIDYDKTFNSVHQLNTFISYENNEVKENGISAFRRYFTSDKLPYLFAGSDDLKNNSESVSIDALASYFGRISYNYDDTYLFQFAFRRDGSIRFSEESGRWGNFPSILTGWIASNENFWNEKLSVINFFKLKASWGQMGNDRVSPFQYLSSYAFGRGGVYGDGRTYYSSLHQSNVPNPNITWEVANIFNTGFESQLFDSRVTLNVDVFYQRRSDILIRRNASVPNFTGLSLPDENFGIVDDKGIEIELGYDSDRRKDFYYAVHGNLAFARNSIVEFDEPQGRLPWQERTGKPIGNILRYKSIGIFRDEEQINSMAHVNGAIPGDVIIKDINEDGKINADDQILMRLSPDPELTFGLSLNSGYKNVRLNILVNGTGPAYYRRLGSQQGLSGDYYQYDADGRWTPENIDAVKPRSYNGRDPYWRGSHVTDLEYQNQYYARLKNIQLSYSFPEKWVNKAFLKMADVYVSGNNLFLIYSSKNRIWDPEFSEDRDNYPLMKVVSIGARVSF